MKNWVDLLILLLSIINIIICFRRGFVQSVFKFFSNILAFVMSYFLYPYVGKLLLHSNAITSGIQKKISPALGQFSYPLPEALQKFLIANENDATKSMLHASNFQEYVLALLSKIAINILSLLIVFVVVKLLFFMVSKALESVTNLPVIKGVNKYAGALLGIAQSLFVIWFLFLLLVPFSNSAPFQRLFVMIEQSYLANFLYEHNILLKYVLTIFY